MAKKKTKSKAQKARKHYESVKAHSKPGGGERFKALEESIAARGGVRNPGAVAAEIGRKKYGQKKMTSFSKAGRKRHRKHGK